MSALSHIRRIADQAGWSEKQTIEALAAHIDHIGAEMSVASFLRREAQKQRDARTGSCGSGPMTTREFLDMVGPGMGLQRF